MTGRARVLVAVLVGFGLLYLLLTPWLRKLRAEAELLETQARRNDAMAAAQGGKEKAAQEAARAAAGSADPETHRRAAALLSEAGRPMEALKSLDTALALVPGDTEALLLKAETCKRVRRQWDAIQAYRAILAKNPDESRALTGLGWLYVTLAWTADARDLLEPATKRLPTEAGLYTVLGAAYLQQNLYTQAEKALLTVKNLAPNQPERWGPLLDAYVKMKRFDQAIALGEDLLRRTPENPQVLNQLQLAYFEAGKLEKSEEAAQKLLKLVPGDIEAHYRLALCAQRRGAEAEMVRELETVAAQQPDMAQTLLLLGQAYLRQGKQAEGKKRLTQYKEIEQQRQRYEKVGYLLSGARGAVEPHLAAARYYKEVGDTAKMAVELQRVLETDPNHAEARQLLGAAESAGSP